MIFRKVWKWFMIPIQDHHRCTAYLPNKLWIRIKYVKKLFKSDLSYSRLIKYIQLRQLSTVHLHWVSIIFDTVFNSKVPLTSRRKVTDSSFRAIQLCCGWKCPIRLMLKFIKLTKTLSKSNHESIFVKKSSKIFANSFLNNGILEALFFLFAVLFKSQVHLS